MTSKLIHRDVSLSSLGGLCVDDAELVPFDDPLDLELLAGDTEPVELGTRLGFSAATVHCSV